MSGARFIPLERAKQLTAALGRDPLEVEAVWFRAKQRMELARRRKASHQALASWANLDEPESSVQDLLVAQSQASELLPYGLPGLRAPLLSTIYVRQLLRDKRLAHDRDGMEASRSVEDSAGDDVLLADDILNRHDHLLIIGEPGTGKSVFCRAVADGWLASGYVRMQQIRRRLSSRLCHWRARCGPLPRGDRSAQYWRLPCAKFMGSRCSPSCGLNSLLIKSTAPAGSYLWMGSTR